MNIEFKTIHQINKRVQYLDINGKLITASLKDYTHQKVHEQYHLLDDFLQKWHASNKKRNYLANKPAKY